MELFYKRPLATSIALFLIAVFAFAKISIPFLCKVIGFCVLFIFATVLALLKKKITLPSLICLGICLSIVVSYIYFDSYIGTQKNYYGTTNDIVFTIDKITYKADYATYCDVTLKKIGNASVSYKAKLDLDFSLEADELDIVKINAVITDFDQTEDDFDEKSYYNSKGYYLLCTANDTKYEIIGKSPENITSICSDINSFCLNRLKNILNDDALGICGAIFLGNKSFLSSSLKRDFSQIGISHMLAVSGLHVSILIGGLYFILRLIFVPKKPRLIICAIFCLIYMGLVGFIPSVVRAGLMYIIMSLSTLFKKESDSLTNLFAAGGIIVLLNPSSINDPSFLLSFFATLGIVSTLPLVGVITSKIKIGIIKNLATSFLITFSAVLFTIPLTFVYFGKVYLLVPLSNLIISPFISIILFLSLFCVPISFIPGVSVFFGILLNFVCAVVKFLVKFFVSLPVGSLNLNYPFVIYIIVAVFSLLVLLLLLKTKKWLLFIPVILGLISYMILSNIYLSDFYGYCYVSFFNNAKNDMLMINDENKTYIFDLSNGGKIGANNMIYHSEELSYDDKIDYYIVTSYNEYIVNTIDKITDSDYINFVYLPSPENDSDNAFYTKITDILTVKNIKFKTYENSITFNDEFNIKLSTKSTSYKLDINIYEKNICCLSRTGGDLFDINEENDIIFFGYHGSSQTESYTANCDLAIFANEELKEENSVSAKSYFNLENTDGFKTVKFSKK